MAKKIPAEFEGLLKDGAFAHLTTLMPDGSPQITPLWVDYDGEHVLLNSEEKRQKTKNVERDPRVALSIQDPENPYRYIQVRGEVVEVTKDGAREHIDKVLSKRYLNMDEYPNHLPDDVRVIFKVRVDRVQTMG